MKMYLGWHYTPNKLTKIHHDLSSKCWRLCIARGTPKHIWWECPVILSLWTQVQNLFDDLIGIKISLTPQLALFNIWLDRWPLAMHAILIHILIATRLSIARHGIRHHPYNTLLTYTYLCVPLPSSMNPYITYFDYLIFFTILSSHWHSDRY